MEKLPGEILIDIFSFLDKQDLLKASLVCRDWYMVIGRGDEKEGLSVWKEKCLRIWKRKLCRIEEYDGDWKRMCYHDNLINKASSWEWEQLPKESGIGVYGDKNNVAVVHALLDKSQLLCSNPCITGERYYIEFHIRYSQRGAINIGLSNRKANSNQRCGFDQNGWSLSLFSGCLFHNNTWTPYTTQCKTGDRIGMAVDMNKRQVYFFRNGINLGLALFRSEFPSSPSVLLESPFSPSFSSENEDLFPSVSFGDTGDCVAIVHNPLIPDF